MTLKTELKTRFDRTKQDLVDVLTRKPSIEGGIMSFEPTIVEIPDKILRDLERQSNVKKKVQSRGILYQPADVPQVIQQHWSQLNYHVGHMNTTTDQLVYGNQLPSGKGLIYFTSTGAGTIDQAISQSNKVLLENGIKQIPEFKKEVTLDPHERPTLSGSPLEKLVQLHRFNRSHPGYLKTILNPRFKGKRFD